MYDYTYYNAIISNNDADTQESDHFEPNLIYNENRNTSLIENCQDYEMAITNFKMDLKTLPTFIPIIKNNSGSPTELERRQTIYNIGIEYNGVLSKMPVYFEPQDLTISSTAPNFIDGKPSYKSEYYNLYSYDYFLTLVNTALQDAFSNLEALCTHYSVAYTPTTNLPFMIYEKSDKLFLMYAPADTFNADGIKIHMNRPLFRLFNSLPHMVVRNSYNSHTLGDTTSYEVSELKTYVLRMDDFGHITSLFIDAPQPDGTKVSNVEYLSIVQDYSTISSFSPVDSIVITSNSIPVKPTVEGNLHSFVNGVETITQTPNDNYVMELSDFKPAGEIQEGVIYQPSFDRFLTLYNKPSLDYINLEFYYKLKISGELIRIKLNAGGCVSIKFLFRKILS